LTLEGAQNSFLCQNTFPAIFCWGRNAEKIKLKF
jgi:hypothetical protein